MLNQMTDETNLSKYSHHDYRKKKEAGKFDLDKNDIQKRENISKIIIKVKKSFYFSDSDKTFQIQHGYDKKEKWVKRNM